MGQAALARARRGALLARFGLRPGSGEPRRRSFVRRRGPAGASTPSIDLALSGRYGLSDERLEGRRPTSRGGQRLATDVAAGRVRRARDASDVAEASGMRNSVAAQEFGVDFTEPYRVRGFDLRPSTGSRSSLIASLAGARERTDSARLEATPARGTYRPAHARPRSDEQGGAAASGWHSFPALLGGGMEGGLSLQVRGPRMPIRAASRVTGTPAVRAPAR